MIGHGEEFGDDSAFGASCYTQAVDMLVDIGSTGTSLVNMGRALCRVATLQETFALTFEDTFLASVIRMEDEIREYQAQRKKLESRR